MPNAIVLAAGRHMAKGQVLEALAVSLVVGAIAAAGHWAREEGVFPFRSRARSSGPRSMHGGEE